MDKRELLIIGILLFLCGVLYFYLQWIIIILNIGGFNYDATVNEIQSIKNENELLNDSLLELESYTYVASKAASMGFVPAPFVTP